MVRIAQGMIQSGAIFGFVIPPNFKSFFAHRREAQARIGEDFMILGSGDIGLPVIFVSTLVRQSLHEAIFVGVFALIGLLCTHILFMSQSKRQPMAALPPIATLTILGYVISLLLNL
jgi:presenilin-like A22 family membrane protease